MSVFGRSSVNQLVLSGQSKSGSCFYVLDDEVDAAPPSYAKLPGAGGCAANGAPLPGDPAWKTDLVTIAIGRVSRASARETRSGVARRLASTVVTALVAAISGVYGLVIGSFLNVVIWRVPRKESIVKPPSHCPACDTKIAQPRQHPGRLVALAPRPVPQLRRPRSRARYPFVELFTGVLFAAVGARFAHSWALPAYLVLTAALIALSAIDLEHYILPNRILYPTDVGDDRAARAWRRRGEQRLGRVRARAASRARSRSSVFFVIHIVSPRGMGFGDVRLVVPARRSASAGSAGARSRADCSRASSTARSSASS